MNNEQLIERLCAAANAINDTTRYVPSSCAIVAYLSNMCDPRRVCDNMQRVGRYLQVLDACFPELDKKHHVEIAFFLLDSGPEAGFEARRHGALSNIRRFAWGADSVLIHGLISAAIHRFPWENLKGDCAVVADISLEHLGSQTFEFESHLELVRSEYSRMDALGLVESDREFYRRLHNHRSRDNRIYRTEILHQAFDFNSRLNLSINFGEVEETPVV